MEDAKCKRKNVIYWRYLVPRLAEEHALPPQQIDKHAKQEKWEQTLFATEYMSAWAYG